MFMNNPITAMNPELARLQMLDEQLRRRGIRSRRVLDAMGRVPRERFMTEELKDLAYADQAAAIDCGQTISQPYIVALMTEALQLSGHERVLEIGTGSGYQTAILAELAGSIVTIERHTELSQRASAVLAELGYKNATYLVGDGSQGAPEFKPYDRILVTAAASKIPDPLVEQLAEAGLIVIPVGGHESQTLQAVRKIGGRLHVEELGACRFVPFVGAQEIDE